MMTLLIAAFLAQPATQPALPPPNRCLAIRPQARPANCPPWRSMGGDAETSMFVDEASLLRDGAAFEIRTWLVFASQRDWVWSVVIYIRYDCRARTLQRRGHTLYDSRGNVVERPMISSFDPAPVPLQPGGSNAAVLAAYCRR